MKNTNEVAHTPTPWTKFDGDDFSLLKGGVYKTNERPIGSIESCPEDAAFIVRAVNAHDELVAALKRAQLAIRTQTYTDMELAQKAIDAALTKVEA